MSNKPFKFRYVNELTGAFVLVACMAIVAAVILAGHAQEWFIPKSTVMIELPESGMAGLKRGAEIQILETEAGVLSLITVDDKGVIMGEMQIDREFMRFIRTDSEAIIRKKFAVAGDSFIEITRGTGDPLPSNHPFIECYKETEVTEMIALIVSQIQNATLPLIEQVRQTLKAYENVALNMTDPKGSVQQLLGTTDSLIKKTQYSIESSLGDIDSILKSVEGIVAGINAGQGPVGKLLKDQDTANDMDIMIQSAKQTMSELEVIALNLKTMTDDLAMQFPAMTTQARNTLDETQVLMNSLESNWLLGGSGKPDDAPLQLPFPEVSP
ncbi:MAG: hypothetical protein EOL87_01835 [Spartobacteria bacterium]|nr:hypothetical protein [Spartobacteria bacterium]